MQVKWWWVVVFPRFTLGQQADMACSTIYRGHVILAGPFWQSECLAIPRSTARDFGDYTLCLAMVFWVSQ